MNNVAWQDVIKVSFDEFMSDERVERVKQERPFGVRAELTTRLKDRERLREIESELVDLKKLEAALLPFTRDGKYRHSGLRERKNRGAEDFLDKVRDVISGHMRNIEEYSQFKTLNRR